MKHISHFMQQMNEKGMNFTRGKFIKVYSANSFFNSEKMTLKNTNFNVNTMLNIINKKLLIHPYFAKIEIDEKTNKLRLFLVNETTKKNYDNHKLLKKLNVPENIDKKHQIVGQGYYKEYDFNNEEDINDFNNFINGLSLDKKNPLFENDEMDSFLNNNQDINFQDIKKIENDSNLLQTINTQGFPCNNLTGDRITDINILNGHTSLTNIENNNKKPISNIENYLKIQQYHKNLSKNQNLNKNERVQHANISNSMEWAKTWGSFLYKKTPF